MGDDLNVMIDGFQALAWLDEHSYEVGMGGTDGTCRPCSRFAAELFRGKEPRSVLGLRCEPAQDRQRQVDAAIAVIKRERPDEGETRA